MKASLTVLSTIFVVLLAGSAIAEVPPLKEAELEKQADVILAGTVVSIRPSEKIDKEDKDWVDTHFEIRVAVGEVLKGKIPAVSKQVTFRGWAASKRPIAWAGPGGNYDSSDGSFRRLSSLKSGQEVKLYLRGKGSTYDLVYPNGFELRSKRKQDR
jgi:hypothetical protein